VGAESRTSESAARVAREASQTVGDTPLVVLQRMGEGLGAEVVAKLEYLNPGGSVKDRIGVAMIDAAERDGMIEPGRSVIVEPTSGNTGIALAMVCAARGYDLVLTLPEGMSKERTALLRTYGAEVHETPSLGGMNEAVALAERIVAERGAYMPQQFNNPAGERDGTRARTLQLTSLAGLTYKVADLQRPDVPPIAATRITSAVIYAY
jgi:cysteine synthase A